MRTIDGVDKELFDKCNVFQNHTATAEKSENEAVRGVALREVFLDQFDDISATRCGFVFHIKSLPQ